MLEGIAVHLFFPSLVHVLIWYHVWFMCRSFILETLSEHQLCAGHGPHSHATSILLAGHHRNGREHFQNVTWEEKKWFNIWKYSLRSCLIRTLTLIFFLYSLTTQNHLCTGIHWHLLARSWHSLLLVRSWHSMLRELCLLFVFPYISLRKNLQFIILITSENLYRNESCIGLYWSQLTLGTEVNAWGRKNLP